MFLLTEARYQFARNRGRSVLLILVSALLCGCVAVYMGNISSAQQALDQLEVNTPVILRVVNADGSASGRLDIFPHNADKLRELGLKDLCITSSGNAAFDPSFKGMDPFMGGDASVAGSQLCGDRWVRDRGPRWFAGFPDRQRGYVLSGPGIRQPEWH